MLAIYLTKLFFSNVLNKQSKALFCSWGSLTFFNVVLLDNLISMRSNDFGDLCEGNFLLGGFCHGFCDKNPRQKQIFSSFSPWTSSMATHICYLTAACGGGKLI
jgi:hypothetical protein